MPRWTKKLIPSTLVWNAAPAVDVPEGLIPEVALPLIMAVEDPETTTLDEEPETTPVEAEFEAAALDAETPLVEAAEPEMMDPEDAAAVPVVMVVPGRVGVGPATVIVVGLVQGQSVMTVGPATIVVVPETMMVSPPAQETELG